MPRSAFSKVSTVIAGLKALHLGTVKALGSPDGRWALVSTSLTASVAVMVTALALDASPGVHALSGLAPVSSPYKSAGLVPTEGLVGPIDRILQRERTEEAPAVETRTLTVETGDTIMGMLQEAGVASDDATRIVNAVRPYYSPRAIKSGQTFQATFGPDAVANDQSAAADDSNNDATPVKRLLALSFAPSLEHEITVKLTAPDNYLAQDVQKKLETHYQHAGGTIDSSLYLSAMQAGIPASVIVEIIHMFSYEVDFQRDVHDGDQFDVFFNHYFTEEGRPAKPGDILAASLTLGGKKHLLYRFETADGVEYFDSDGQSAKSLLMKTPVDGARISSGFGARFHPILGYNRMHKGIDFAVPTGTPVMAAGAGTISFEGRANGYGNFVVINHANGYSTAYGHLSRFAPGIHTGSHVYQGEVVAYSGMTGLATGPHLHYEIRVHNAQVNPASVKVAAGRKLEGRDMEAFVAERTRIETLLASTPVQRKLAEIQGLRQTSVQ